MITLYSLYQLAAKHNIEIINMPLKTSKAKIVEYCDQTCIAIDKRQLNNINEEQQILEKCLGHYFSNSLYSINSTEQVILNCNNAAKKWVCDNLNL